MAKRVKTTGPAIRTREEMENVVGRICGLTILVDKTKALMDQRLMEVRAQYEQQLGQADKELPGLMAMARDWAESHPEEFSGRKSIDMTHGMVGFRTGQPTLKTVGGWTWKIVQEVIAPKYIRTRHEPDKEKLLADREILGEAGLRKWGLRVVQDESFFVEPKREPVESGPVNVALENRKES